MEDKIPFKKNKGQLAIFFEEIRLAISNLAGRYKAEQLHASVCIARNRASKEPASGQA